MGAGASSTVRWLARAVCWVFYRIDRVGAVPPDGAVLLLPNHPNSLLDPAVVWATAERDVRFLAKSTLFESALRPVLASAGAIPVYRKRDEGVDTSRNEETFAAVSAALASGAAVCIFPEGISHSTGRLEPLRTGAARMALDAERRGTRVALVPVGLNFDRKTTFRSRATIVFGQPFSARDLDAAEEDHVRALTQLIAERMRLLLVEADPDADAALVDRVDRLYTAARGRPRDPQARLVRRRTIAEGMARLRTADPARYEAVLERLHRYDQRLQRFGLHDRHLDWQVSPRDAVLFAAREIPLAIVLLPVCLIGFALFFVPYQATAVVARRFTRERDILATAQVFSGAAVYAAWLLVLSAIAWMAAGRTAAIVTFFLLPVVALVSLLAIERESAVVQAVRSWRLLTRASDETRERLRRRRSEVADVLDEVNRWLESNVDR